jgi:hypothetical protein
VKKIRTNELKDGGKNPPQRNKSIALFAWLHYRFYKSCSP